MTKTEPKTLSPEVVRLLQRAAELLTPPPITAATDEKETPDER